MRAMEHKKKFLSRLFVVSLVWSTHFLTAYLLVVTRNYCFRKQAVTGYIDVMVFTDKIREHSEWIPV